MSIITKILLPVDFSESAKHAFDYGVTLAREHGASIVIHHAYAVPVSIATEAGATPPAVELAAALAQLGEAMKRLEVEARERGVRQVETACREGVAWHSIVEVAKALGCDLIVMGTHGRSGIAHFLVGSVAEKVVQKAHCPVLAVKSPAAVVRVAAPAAAPVDEMC